MNISHQWTQKLSNKSAAHTITIHSYFTLLEFFLTQSIANYIFVALIYLLYKCLYCCSLQFQYNFTNLIPFMMIRIFLMSYIFVTIVTINFPITFGRETCLHVKQKGQHQIQYIVSGNTPTQYRFTLYSNSELIENLTAQTQYDKIIQFKSENNKICFTSTDNQTKQISFDIMSTQNPLADHFSVKKEEETHQAMFKAFQELQKVYRDQHMFIERSTLYQIALGNKQIKILLILAFKIFAAGLMGFYQLLLLKDIITSKTLGYYLPQAVQDQDSEEEEEM